MLLSATSLDGLTVLLIIIYIYIIYITCVFFASAALHSNYLAQLDLTHMNSPDITKPLAKKCSLESFSIFKIISVLIDQIMVNISRSKKKLYVLKKNYF